MHTYSGLQRPAETPKGVDNVNRCSVVQYDELY
jgi:hypothetical protein